MDTVDLLWLNGNEDWLYQRAIPHRRLVVRVIDDYAGFGKGYTNNHPLMMTIVRKAEAVFTCTEAIKGLYSAARPDVRVVPNGCDWNHFAQHRAAESPYLHNVPRPRIVYVGAVSHWFDQDLLKALASARQNWQFVIAGPWERSLAATKLSNLSNVHILGPVRYGELPQILAHSDVGIIPFKATRLVRGVSPIKVYEYLASGLPTVSTRWAALEEEQLPVILAAGAREFEKGIAESLDRPPVERQALRVAARGYSWESRLRTILETVGLSLEQ